MRELVKKKKKKKAAKKSKKTAKRPVGRPKKVVSKPKKKTKSPKLKAVQKPGRVAFERDLQKLELRLHRFLVRELNSVKTFIRSEIYDFKQMNLAKKGFPRI